MSHARGEGLYQSERAGDSTLSASSGGIPADDGFNSLEIGPKNSRIDLARMESRAARCLVSRQRRTSPLEISSGTLEDHSGLYETTDSVGGSSHFRDDFGWNSSAKSALNLTQHFQCRHAAIRMRRPAKCQKSRRLSTRRHRVHSRQSGGLKRKIPWPCRTSLLRSIFSPVAFGFSS